MHCYQFQALGINGKKVHGTIHAHSHDQAFHNLKQKGLYPIQLNQKSFKLLNSSSFSWTIEWSRDMSFFLKQGLSLSESLEISKLRLNKHQKQFIDMVLSKLHMGLTLSQIFSQYPIFPKLFIGLLNISEATGQYTQAFEDYALIKQEGVDFSKKLKASLQYPLILAITLLTMIVLFSQLLLPVALDFLIQNNYEQHIATRLFIYFSKALEKIFSFATDLPSVASVFISFYLIFKTKKLQYFLSWLSTICPIFGPIYLMSLQYFYLKSFSMLLKRGYQVTQSANYCAEALQNSYFKKRAQKISHNITHEGKISSSLTKELKLSPPIEQLLLIGENTAQLPLYSSICAQTLKNAYQIQLQKIIAWTGPTLIFIMGIILIWMVVAFVIPIYDQIARMD